MKRSLYLKVLSILAMVAVFCACEQSTLIEKVQFTSIELMRTTQTSASMTCNINKLEPVEGLILGICLSTDSLIDESDLIQSYSSFGTSITYKFEELNDSSTYFAGFYLKTADEILFSKVTQFTTLPKTKILSEVMPLLNDRWVSGYWPYNAYYPVYEGDNSINGHYQAACGPTALSRILCYWGSHLTYAGTIDAMNTWGAVRFTCNLESLNINFNNLYVSLPEEATEAQYTDVAKIFLAAGAVGLTNAMDAGTPPDEFIDALREHFTLDEDVHFAIRWEYSKEARIEFLKSELSAGCPLAMAARTADSPAPSESGTVQGHWFNIDGYNSENLFHISYNWKYGNFEGYYDVDDFGDYNSYGMVIAGFKPAE